MFDPAHCIQPMIHPAVHPPVAPTCGVALVDLHHFTTSPLHHHNTCVNLTRASSLNPAPCTTSHTPSLPPPSPRPLISCPMSCPPSSPRSRLQASATAFMPPWTSPSRLTPYRIRRRARASLVCGAWRHFWELASGLSSGGPFCRCEAGQEVYPFRVVQCICVYVCVCVCVCVYFPPQNFRRTYN